MRIIPASSNSLSFASNLVNKLLQKQRLSKNGRKLLPPAAVQKWRLPANENEQQNEQQPNEFHPIYSDQHRILGQSLRKFIAAEVNPRVEQWEREKQFPAKELFRQLAEFGVFGANKPKEYGGLGLDFSYSLAIAEALGECSCGAIPMAVCVQAEMATPALAQFGTDRLKREFLAPSIGGQRVACLGVSEPNAGSDVAAIRTTARKSGGDLIINGRKQWITNGHQADWICLLVRTPNLISPGSTSTCPQSPHGQMSLICVDMAEPGIRLGKPIQKLGMHCSDTAEIEFEECRVPLANVIGEPGQGFRLQMRQFQNERLVTAAVVLRPLERIIAQTARHSMGRPLFGSTVFEQQTVKYGLAQLATELDALRALLYQATMEKVKGGGQETGESSSKVKWMAGQLARRIPDQCLQYWGALGFAWDNEISRFYRDFRLISIGAGCDEVMLAIVAKHMQRALQ